MNHHLKECTNDKCDGCTSEPDERLTDVHDLKNCPECNANMVGDPIPKEDRKYYGKSTNFSNWLGIEVRGKYDGISYWQCPSCKTTWDRFTGKKFKLGAK